jgi:hypothetical protein
VISVVLATGLPVSAAPGDLDAAFGAAGVAGPFTGEAEAVVDAGGKVVIVSSTSIDINNGTLIVRRLLANGVADNTFSTDGEIILAVAGNPTTAAVTVDTAGRVLVVAGLIGGGGVIGYDVFRLTAAGEPDTTFSTDGLATIDNPGGFTFATGIGVQPDGDIIVGIADTVVFGGFAQMPQIVKIANDGTVGTIVDVLPDFILGGSHGAVVSVDGTGRTYVMVPVNGRVLLYRYTEALALDAAFSGDGKLEIRRPGGGGDNRTWGGALHINSSGVALVASTFGTETGGGAVPPVDTELGTAVARVTAAGTLDTSFSGDGIALLARPTGSIEPSAVGATASGGAAVVASRSIDFGTPSGLVWELTKGGFASTAFSGDGRLERAASPTAAGVGASGTRVRLFESNDLLTSSTLSSVVLDAKIDLAKPVAKMSKPATRWTLTTTVPAAWTATDVGTGVASYDVARRAGTWNGALAAIPSALLSGTTLKATSFKGTAGTTYCLATRARDKAANVGAYSADRCTAVPLRADQLTYSTGWTKRTLGPRAGPSARSPPRTQGHTRPPVRSAPRRRAPV